MKDVRYYALLFITSIIGFLSGTIVRSFFLDEGGLFIYTCFIILFAGVFGFWKHKKTMVFCFFILFLIFGVWRSDEALEIVQGSVHNGKQIHARGYISQEPRLTQFSSRLIVTLRSCDERITFCSGGKIMVSGNRWEPYQYGEEIQMTCTLSRVENFSDDFDWRMYLAKDGVYYECEERDLVKTGDRNGNSAYGYLLDLRRKMEHVVNLVIPQPEAALGSGLLFGGSSRLSDELQDDFSKTSMTHIVAVSGYNVSILSYYFLIIGIALGLRRQQAFWFAVLGIGVFVAMIGFPSSAIRAGIMGVLLLWAMKQGRLSDSLRALLLAAAIMLAWNPLLLRWDIGFQLSFMATLGIILLSPFWEDRRIMKGTSIGLVDIVFVTFAAQIFVIPIVLYHFHMFSPISFLANLLILGIVPITMVFVFLSSVVGLIWLDVGQIFGWIAYIFLKYEISVIQFLADHDRWQMVLEDLPIIYVVLWYGIVLSSIVYMQRKRIFKMKAQCRKYENV